MGRGRIAQNELLTGLSEKYNVSLSRLCIRFALQGGILPIPKSNHKERLMENLDVFGFEISEEDMDRIQNMESAGWSGEDPRNRDIF